MTKHGIVAMKGLDEQSKQEIADLEKVCNDYDRLSIRLCWSDLNSRPKDEVNDFLYYEDEKLIGFLGLYDLHDTREIEISGMVHPDFRRKGIFTSLTLEVVKECRKRGIPKILFICEKTSASGKEYVGSSGAIYKVSEYKMILDEEKFKNVEKPSLQFRKAKSEDSQARIDILFKCFGIEIEDKEEFDKNPYNAIRNSYVGEVEGKVVANVSANNTDGEIYIHALGVLSEFRGRGYGKELLSLTVEKMLQEQHNNITLEVACQNENALTLYKKSGFEVETAYDYYEKEIMGYENREETI